MRVAAAHQGGFSSTTGGGVAAGYAGGFGVPAMGAGYQSVKYSSPPFDGKAKNFKSWLQDFCLVANGANLLDHLQEGTVEVPVNSGQSKHSLCQQYPPEQVELAFHAWNFLNHALVKGDDKKTMKRAQTPQGASYPGVERNVRPGVSDATRR